MMIDGHPTEKEALHQAKLGNMTECYRLEAAFIEEFHAAYNDSDHCPCNVACKWHGKCKECVAIHRAHMDHLPNCLHPLVNAKLCALSELTEHTVAFEITPPEHPLLKKIKDSNDYA